MRAVLDFGAAVVLALDSAFVVVAGLALALALGLGFGLVPDFLAPPVCACACITSSADGVGSSALADHREGLPTRGFWRQIPPTDLSKTSLSDLVSSFSLL